MSEWVVRLQIRTIGAILDTWLLGCLSKSTSDPRPCNLYTKSHKPHKAPFLAYVLSQPSIQVKEDAVRSVRFILHVNMCVYIYICICIYFYMHICMRIRTDMCIYVHIHIRARIHLYICTYLHLKKKRHRPGPRHSLTLHMYMYIYICINRCVYIYIHIEIHRRLHPQPRLNLSLGLELRMLQDGCRVFGLRKDESDLASRAFCEALGLQITRNGYYLGSYKYIYTHARTDTYIYICVYVYRIYVYILLYIYTHTIYIYYMQQSFDKEVTKTNLQPAQGASNNLILLALV